MKESGKIPVKQQYFLNIYSQYGELRLTNGWDWLASLGHPSKFQRVSRLGVVTAPTSLNGGQPNFAQCLAISWAATPCIHFEALGILLRIGATLTLRPSLVFSCIGSVTARHSSHVSQPNFAACDKEGNCWELSLCATYIPQGDH